MATSYEMRNNNHHNSCMNNGQIEEDVLENRIDRAILLALEVTEILKQLTKIDPCACLGFTIEQLKLARARAQELQVVLDRLVLRLSFTDITFRYYNLIITSATRNAQAVEGLTLLLQSDYCLPDGKECKGISIYEGTLIDIQTVLNNLVAVAKFLMID